MNYKAVYRTALATLGLLIIWEIELGGQSHAEYCAQFY